MTYKEDYKPIMSTKETVEEVLTYPIKAIPSRGITKSTCEHFQVRVGLSEVDGETINAIYFPWRKEGKITGFKKKDLTIPKEADNHFTHIGHVGSSCDLFGEHEAPEGGKKSFTVEGEMDVLALWQIITEKTNKSRNPAVVGIGGTSWAKKQISNRRKFYTRFTENIFAFDGDQCTPEELKAGNKKGKEALDDVAKIMPDILVAKFTSKDSNQMLLDGKAEEAYWAVMAKAEKYIPQSLVQGGVGLERLMKPLERGVYIPSFPKTMDKLKGFREGEMTIVLAPPGVGKCLGKGTLVRMFDGSLKKVEEVIVGDNLMGPDSTSRLVTSTVKGSEQLYKVIQSCGEDYVVNKSHILSLKASKSDGTAKKGNILNEDIQTYIESTQNHKNIWKGYRVGFTLKDTVKPSVDPYLIGLWLADGNSNCVKITVNTRDVEIVDYLKTNFKLGHTVKSRGCSSFYIKNLISIFRGYNLLFNKHIPEECFKWSVEDRFKLLAGFIDGDGSNCNGGVEITSKYPELFYGVKSLCHTIGFFVSEIKDKEVNGSIYKRGIIKGDFNKVPLLLERKRHVNGINSNLSTLKFEDIGVGDYYGFTLEGKDKLFLLEDGTVTHNTTICKAIGYGLNKQQKSLFHIFVEEDIEKTQQSYIALDNHVMLPKLRASPNIITKEQWEKSYKELIDNGRTLWLDHFGSINPDVLMSDIRWAAANGYEFVILDHISMVFSGLATMNERKEIDMLLTELAAFTKGSKIHPIVVSHVKRTQKTLEKDKSGKVKYPYWDTVAADAARGSGAFEQLAWNIISLEPEILESGERGRIRTRVWKNREWNILGVGDILTMDQNTGLLINAEDSFDGLEF